MPVVDKYNAWAGDAGYPTANHFIVTHYVDGAHNIGMHFDKAKSIAKGSLITIVKTGAVGRPFRLERGDGTLLMDRVLPPGTAVVMTLEANLVTKHGVPTVPEAGASGSIVFRTITERVGWEQLKRKLAKTTAAADAAVITSPAYATETDTPHAEPADPSRNASPESTSATSRGGTEVAASGCEEATRPLHEVRKVEEMAPSQLPVRAGDTCSEHFTAN